MVMERESWQGKPVSAKSDPLRGEGGRRMEAPSFQLLASDTEAKRGEERGGMDQKRARVHFSRNKLRAVVEVDIYIYGSGASDAAAQAIEHAIMNRWNAGWTYVDLDSGDALCDVYDVIFDVNVQVLHADQPSKGPGWFGRGDPLGNYIEVTGTPEETPRSVVRGGRNGEWYGGSRGATFAHEFGHLIGLDDRYTDIDEQRSKPDKGWEGNIMGSLNGAVEQVNINAIMNEMMPKYRNTDDYRSGRDRTVDLREDWASW